jgi:hypothetical protein
MILNKFIKEVIKSLPKEDLEVGITFEVGLEADGKTINNESKNRVKFSITNKKILKVDKFKNLDILKDEYRKYCINKKEIDTYRGLLGWLNNKGLEIDYFEGIELGLLTFNNKLYEEINYD